MHIGPPGWAVLWTTPPFSSTVARRLCMHHMISTSVSASDGFSDVESEADEKRFSADTSPQRWMQAYVCAVHLRMRAWVFTSEYNSTHRCCEPGRSKAEGISPKKAFFYIHPLVILCILNRCILRLESSAWSFAAWTSRIAIAHVKCYQARSRGAARSHA
jgi:hypothetical protein